MNKNSFFRIAFLTSLIAGSTISYSQTNSKDMAVLDALKKANESIATTTTAAGPAEKAQGIFNRMFGNAMNVTWATDIKGLSVVYFETPGKKNRAGFNKKGNLEYTISYYQEDQLPEPVLLRVKETYFGRSIFGITEVNIDGKTAYLIILEDKTTWLHIKVLGDEMEEEHLYKKG